MVVGLDGLCGEAGLGGEAVEGVAQGAGGAGIGELGGAGHEEAVPGGGVEAGGSPAQGCGLVAVGVGDAFDEPVEAEAAQVVGHLAGGDVFGGGAEEFGEEGS